MRRVPASLVLLLLGLGYALPFLQSGRDTTPACCRREGKHHCTMAPNGDGFHSVAANCSHRHPARLVSHSIALSVPAALSAATRQCHELLLPASPDIARRSFGNAQKRGPPAV